MCRFRRRAIRIHVAGRKKYILVIPEIRQGIAHGSDRGVKFEFGVVLRQKLLRVSIGVYQNVARPTDIRGVIAAGYNFELAPLRPQRAGEAATDKAVAAKNEDHNRSPSPRQS